MNETKAQIQKMLNTKKALKPYIGQRILQEVKYV